MESSILRSLILAALPVISQGAGFHRASVVVYGDSPSAFSAAIELAESSHDVLLVCPVAHVGGMMVEGLGHQDVDSRSGNGAPIGGLTAEFYLRIGAAYGSSSPRYRFEAKVAQQVIDNWLAEEEVRQLRNARLSEAPGAVTKTGGRITSIRLEDGSVIAGDVFIDGTVEGDLMAAAGVTHTWGREGNAAYGENTGGILNPTHKDQYAVSVDPYVIPGNPSSGVIKGVQDEGVGTHGAGDQSVMGFCLRLPLTKNPANKIPITAPPGYDPADYEIYRRYLAAGGTNDWLDGPGTANSNPTQKLYDLGSWHDLSGNLYGRNHDYPNASHARRQEIYREHKEYTQGLIWFLSNDPSVPQSIRDEWSKWGLPADEFTDNGGWPRRLYVRSARRMISDYVITEADVITNQVGSLIPRPPVDDPIGLCWWPVDHHNARTVIRNGKVYNEGAFFTLSNYDPFGVPYRAIVPKRADCTNLLVPSALSSSYAGYGAVRLEWTFMVLGQSAGTAAAIAADTGIAVQDVPYSRLSALLLARKQKLTLASPSGGITMDNLDSTGVQIAGSWTTSTTMPGHIGPNYLHDGNTGKGTKSVRFTPAVPATTVFKVQAIWNSDSARSNSVPITITHAGGTTSLTVNQQINGTSWQDLGTHTFSEGTGGSVLISNSGTSGYVIVDAVRFIPLETASPQPVILMAARKGTCTEGRDPATVVIHRTSDASSAASISLSYAGTAVPGTDTAVLPSTVHFAAGQSTTELAVTALSDPLIEGAETLTVMAGTESVTVHILDPPFQSWQKLHFPVGGDPAPDSDPDSDGVPNLLEFALSGNPNGADPELSGELRLSDSGTGPLADFSYWRNAAADPAHLKLRSSPDLSTWQEMDDAADFISFDDANNRVFMRLRFPIPGDPGKRFFRLEYVDP